MSIDYIGLRVSVGEPSTFPYREGVVLDQSDGALLVLENRSGEPFGAFLTKITFLDPAEIRRRAQSTVKQEPDRWQTARTESCYVQPLRDPPAGTEPMGTWRLKYSYVVPPDSSIASREWHVWERPLRKLPVMAEEGEE